MFKYLILSAGIYCIVAGLGYAPSPGDIVAPVAEATKGTLDSLSGWFTTWREFI